MCKYCQSDCLSTACGKGEFKLHATPATNRRPQDLWEGLAAHPLSSGEMMTARLGLGMIFNNFLVYFAGTRQFLFFSRYNLGSYFGIISKTN